MARKLVVEIVGDASSLEKSFKRASNGARGFERDMGAASRGAVAGSGAFAGLGRSVAFASGSFLGGLGFTAAIKSTVQASSDLTESINAVEVVFGDASETILDFSNKAVKEAGLSMAEFNQLATPVGAMLQNTGDSATEAAEKTIILTKRAADMASVFNTPVRQALEAIQSALRGEADPIEVFGVKLNEAAVNAEVMRLGLANSVGAIDESAKAQGRYSLILQQTSRFQGDFARTSDSAANKVKLLQANVKNLQAEIGEGLIPVLSDAVTLLDKLIALRAKGREDVPGGKFFFGTISDQFHAFEEDTENMLKALGLLEEKAKAVFEPAGARGPVSAGVLPPAGIRGPVGEPLPTEEELRRRRQANEAFRQEVEDRAQLAVDRTKLTKTLADDLRALNAFNALLARRIAGSHATVALEREQLSVQLQIADIVRQQAEARKAAREEAQRAARAARDARQFGLLGLGPTGEEKVPGVSALQKQLQSLQGIVAGSFLDTRKTRSILAGVRAALRDGLRGMSEDVRRRIQEILADLRSQLKQSSVDVTKFHASAGRQFAAAGAHPGGGVVITGPVHFHGVQDVKAMEDAIAKRRKQRARQRRGNR